ncbi:glycoside hydrolase family 43 protein [Agromyces silvae]|uniref:glycoside hydrolase family 43 protein n=1 Tax=Agromyces silvae TaxID=3388266 RepID=UPI00280C30DD|nr:glycoside hydrolase family 43 protein [Agromyces protaetiae]
MRRPGNALAAAGAALTAAIAGGLAGCAGPGGPPATEAATDASAEPSPFEPVIDRDFPDPDVLSADGRYWLYATNGNGRNVQAAVSDDLQEWELLAEDPLPDLPNWVIPGKTWAPEVTEIADGQYVMYFTATNFSPARQCIGVATATSPEGPFTVVGEGMLVCPADEGGAIDASTFVDADGTPYLLWKNDGNCCGLDTWISAAPLSADGLALAGEPTRLIMQTLPWEGDLVEAPTMVVRDGVYHLWYSANDYGGDAYAVGHATATALAGPWTKDDEPFLSTDDLGGALHGPGGQDVVRTDDGDVFVFHAWDDAFLGRRVHTAAMTWDGDVPSLGLGG